MIAMNAEANRSKDNAEAATLYFKSRGERNVKIERTSLVAQTLHLTPSTSATSASACSPPCSSACRWASAPPGPTG